MLPLSEEKVNLTTQRLKLSKLSSLTSSTSISTSVSHGEPSSNSTDTECCECSRTYNEDVRQGTGVEWVQCGCERWLLQDVKDIVHFVTLMLFFLHFWHT